MNADEIVRALREMLPPKVDFAELVCAEGFAHGQCYVWDDPEPYIISAAADLIESLQAQLADYHHMSELVDGKMEENQRLRRINENLQEQLAASQRRERAAVEDLNSLARFEKERCAYCLHDEECEPGEMLCSYKGDKAFEWRGPQDAD